MAHDGMTTRQRKGLTAAQQLLGPGAAVRTYVAGQAQARLTTTAIVIMSTFGVAFVTALVLAGVVLFPGILVALLVYSSVRPYRGLAVTDGGVVLFEVSKMSGRPSRPITILPFPILWPPYAEHLGRSVRLHTGADTVTIRETAFRLLLDSVPRPDASASAAAGPAGPYPLAPPAPPVT